ncbi:MAG: spore maturation protein A [Oscillospiraceae bacterium]
MLNIVIVVFVAVSVIYSIISGSISQVSSASLESGIKAVELTMQLAASMALWGGLMRVAEKSGLTKKINRILSVVLKRFFKGIDKDGAVMRSLSMNVTANLLGLGNAATPLGITAMKEMVKEERAKGTTANIAKLVLLNTASVQLIPVTVSALRLKYGSSMPWDCTLPILVNSAVSLVFGMMAVYAFFGRRKTACNGLLRTGSACAYMPDTDLRRS